MAETIRYRPVLIGEPPQGGEVYYIAERPDGRIFFRDMENPWLLEGTLEGVTPADLPEYYLGLGAKVRLLPIREASGATPLDADDALINDIESLAERGARAESAADEKAA